MNPPTNVNSSGASILHQPVHIATPAPSPPPSPPVGGKAGKKQNYQTNQNFPFMYPPLDSTSNSAGGKGTAGLQDLLVGRKWEGSDIPKSILEAGELFAGRMRMTRAMRQLWDERERFLRFERGWDDRDDEDIEELDLEHILADGLKSEKSKSPKVEVDYGPRQDISDEVKRKLDLVESFYVSLLLPPSHKSDSNPWVSTAIFHSAFTITCYSSYQGYVGERYEFDESVNKCPTTKQRPYKCTSQWRPRARPSSRSRKHTSTKSNRSCRSHSRRNRGNEVQRDYLKGSIRYSSHCPEMAQSFP